MIECVRANVDYTPAIILKLVTVPRMSEFEIQTLVREWTSVLSFEDSEHNTLKLPLFFKTITIP